ncbi:hypothetical protein R3P38DRAFT_2690938 [Favolaschia claudopus]|uniref:Zn(2)-C6 fungal-type domain-containing protein n=1 Tax=Favolaschia claudopus TaxID=2862362 RepID=A0AAW0D141_9AGAR
MSKSSSRCSPSETASATPAPSPTPRGPKACTNCRRRKIKCDCARPICSQCRLRPPRSKEACQYPQLEGIPNSVEGSPSQMLETITTLRARIEELEFLNVQDPTQIFLNSPYTMRSQGSNSPELHDFTYLASGSPVDMPESPLGLVSILLDSFLERFENSGYLFLDPSQFRQSSLTQLSFDTQDRPSPALLNVACLWGSCLSPGTPPYTADFFLPRVLKHIPQDLSSHTQFILDTIQAEVLLSLYYLYTARPVQGRYHAAAAASIALGADLHLIRSPTYHPVYPPFTLQTSASLPPAQNSAEEAIRIDAFWTVVIVNNFWAAVDGSSSPIPYSINIDSPWPATPPELQGGSTIIKFLNGNDDTGYSAVSILAKASILLERVITFNARTSGPPDPLHLASLDHRLRTFHSSLPSLSPTGGAQQTLILTHALLDLAHVRLHAPFTRTSDDARTKCLAAGARVVQGVGAVSILHGAPHADCMLANVYSGVAWVYINEILVLAQQGGMGGLSAEAQSEASELEGKLGTLMSSMASLAAYSPLFDRCFVELRAAYAAMSLPHVMLGSGNRLDIFNTYPSSML